MFITRRRRQMRSAAAAPDVDATAYINKLSTSGTVTNTESAAIYTCIGALKANGHWNTLDKVQLISPSSADGALLCAKTLLYMNNFNAMSWSTQGFQGDGATSCLQITKNLDSFTNATFNGCHVHICQNNVDYDSSLETMNGMFGAATASGGVQMFFYYDPGDTLFHTNMTAGWMSIDAVSTGSDPSSTPFQLNTGLSLESKSVLNVFNDGANGPSNYQIKYAGSQFTGTTQTFPAMFPYVGALNYGNGHPENCTAFEIRSLLVGGPRTQAQSQNLNSIIYNYQANLGLGREQGI